MGVSLQVEVQELSSSNFIAKEIFFSQTKCLIPSFG